jgi:hypothetical protein
MHVHHFLNLIMHAHRVEVGFLSCHQILLIRTMASDSFGVTMRTLSGHRLHVI